MTAATERLQAGERATLGDASAIRASVIVVNYNGGDALLACLRSLEASLRHDDEIVVVDNASVDGSAERVERVFGLRVEHSTANLGFAAACNRGAQLARGSYLVFVNPDTVAEPGWLDALVDALEQEPGAGLATSKVLLLDMPELINTCGNQSHITGLTLCRGMGLGREHFPVRDFVSAVSGAAFAVRRQLWQQLGGFDETFFMYLEDTDLSWRAQLAGYRCLYVPESVVYHDYALRFGPHKVYYQERNRYQMLLKTLRWRTLLALAPALVLAEALTWGFTLVRDRRPANKLRAYGWIVSNRRGILQRRRQVQAARKVGDRELLAGCTHHLAYEQTGDSLAARLAHRICDPLFGVCRRLALAVVRW